MDEIEQALTKDPAVKKARAALMSAEAEAARVRETIAAGSQRAAEIEREISRVEREGDTKANVVALYRSLDAARAAVQEDEYRLRPLQSAVTQCERAVARARRAVLEREFDRLRADAREAERAVFGAVQTLEREVERIDALEREHGRALVLWRECHKEAGDSHHADTDLGSLHRRSREQFAQFSREARKALSWTHSRQLVA